MQGAPRDHWQGAGLCDGSNYRSRDRKLWDPADVRVESIELSL